MDPVLETQENQEPTDDFGDAFAEATTEVPESPATPSEPAAAPAAKEGVEAAAQAPAEKPSDVPADKPADVPADKPADVPADKPAEPAAPAPVEKPAEPAAQPPAQPVIDPKYLAQALNEYQQQQAAAAAQNKPAEPSKPLAASDFYSPEDKAAVDKFAKEWPEEMPAIEKMIAAHAQALVGNQINTLINQLNPILADVTSQQQAYTQTSLQTFVQSKHPDIAEILPKLPEWIKTQPPLYQSALQQVYDAGNAQQVVDLLDMYKKSQGQTGAAAAPPASSAAQEPKPPKTAPPAAAIAALAAVPAAQRSAPTARPDESNFDAAFDEAAQKFG